MLGIALTDWQTSVSVWRFAFGVSRFAFRDRFKDDLRGVETRFQRSGVFLLLFLGLRFASPSGLFDPRLRRSKRQT